MTTLKRQSVSELTKLEPKLKKFSERQIEVAQTWALHFRITPSQLTSFIERYLNSTAYTRCWCVALGSTDGRARPALARVGNLLQYFDGQRLMACRINAKDRVHRKKPTASVAQQLVLRFKARWYADVLLTSFCKSAREAAKTLSVEDLCGFRLSAFDSSGSNNRYFNPRSQFYLAQIGSTLKQFCQFLDQELLFAIRSAQCPSPKLYNWLAQGNRKRRLQALKAQPVLIPLVVLGEHWPWPWNDQERVYMTSPWDELQECQPNWSDDGSLNRAQACLMGRIADTGLPLNDTLAWLLQTPRSSIRYLGQQRVFDTGSALTRISREGPDGPWQRLLLGASLGNRRPSTKAQWKTFFDTLDKVPFQLREQTQDWNRLFSGCPTDWSNPEWPQIAGSLQDLNEVFNNINECHGTVGREALQRVKRFVSSATYLQIASLVTDFHQALVEIRTALDATQSQTQAESISSWTPLLDEPGVILAPNGLQIIELICPADLDEESRSLGHCIHSYDYSAFGGYCRLVSIRENGRSLASAEIQLRTEKHYENTPTKWTQKHLVMTQLRGEHNNTPKSGSNVDQAFKWFWANLKTGQLPTNLEWPDLTQSITRYTNNNRKTLHAQACAEWVNQRLSRA